MEEPYVHKVFTGKNKVIGDPQATNKFDQQWETSMFKRSTDQQIWLSETGLAGDEGNEVAPDKALLAYSIRHYAYWEQTLNVEKIEMGNMGENLSVLEMDEFTVCVGDIYQFGDAVIQVSQPRQPCWKLARRFRQLDLAIQMQNSGRTGWYFRVLEEGDIISRIDLELIERPCPQWSIAACNEVMHIYQDDLRLADDLASCELLSKSWQRILSGRLRGKKPAVNKRIYGSNV